ncbi:MAG: hypothetical protein R2855_12010 [Thermomicrobiales bacterium]
MAVSPDPDQLAERARQIAEALQAFRADSPDATFTELEDAVDTALSELRRDLLAAQVAAHPLRDSRGGPPPQCPDCGAALLSHWAGAAHGGDPRHDGSDDHTNGDAARPVGASFSPG